MTSRNLSPEAGIQDQSRGVGNIKSGYFDSRPVPGETSITWPAEREETLGSRGGQLEDIQSTLLSGICQGVIMTPGVQRAEIMINDRIQIQRIIGKKGFGFEKSKS